MAQVPELRDRLLAQEAPLLEIDRPLKAGLGRERPGREIHAHQGVASSDSPDSHAAVSTTTSAVPRAHVP